MGHWLFYRRLVRISRLDLARAFARCRWRPGSFRGGARLVSPASLRHQNQVLTDRPSRGQLSERESKRDPSPRSYEGEGGTRREEKIRASWRRLLREGVGWLKARLELLWPTFHTGQRWRYGRIPLWSRASIICPDWSTFFIRPTRWCIGR